MGDAMRGFTMMQTALPLPLSDSQRARLTDSDLDQAVAWAEWVLRDDQSPNRWSMRYQVGRLRKYRQRPDMQTQVPAQEALIRVCLDSLRYLATKGNDAIGAIRQEERC